MTVYIIAVTEPDYSQIASGIKTVEARLAEGSLAKMKPGDKILFNASDSEMIQRIVVETRHYTSFDQAITMLTQEQRQQMLPGFVSTNNMKYVLNNTVSVGKQYVYGVLVFTFQ